MDLTEKRKRVLDEDLCDHCTGRQFAQLGHGLENFERGMIVRENENLEKEDFVQENIPKEAELGGECKLCQGVFEQLDRYVEMVENAFERYELETFLIGIRPPEEVLANEEDLWETTGIEHTEPIKTELSRLIGKRLEDRNDIEVEFGRPDINAVIDMREGKERVEMQVNSLLVYGQYNKYSRELPQTEWHCRNCRGGGCEQCDYTGKNYPTSVQEIIQEPFMRETKAIEAKFHGGGREDVDAKCLGRREFVIEMIEPLNRDLDLKQLQEEVNESQDRVEIFEARYAQKDEIAEIKQKHADKAYRAKVVTEEEFEEEDLDKIEEVKGEVVQRTPVRVEHRRADKDRERKVYSIDTEKTGEKEFELEVKAEAGTYIKELIHGDEGRTQPNISDKLGVQAECVELDVIEIEK